MQSPSPYLSFLGFRIELVEVIFEIVLVIMGIQMISSAITGKHKIPKDKINKTQFLDLPKQARFIYHDPSRIYHT